MDYIERFIHYNRKLPSPTIYKETCALFSLACSVGRNIYLGPWNKPIYPNLYIGLVGPPAILHKSTCIEVAEQIVEMAEVTNHMPNAGSREVIAFRLKKLQNPPPAQIDTWEDVVTGAEGSFFVGELSDLFGMPHVKDDKLIGWFQTWFDSRPPYRPWTYDSLSREGEPEKLYQLCIQLAFGTTPRYIHDKFPEGCTEQGWGSRVLWVCQGPEEAISSRVPLDWQVEESVELSNFLREVRKIRQEIVFTLEGKNFWDEWNTVWFRSMQSSKDDRTRGFLARQPEYLIKLGILKAVSKQERWVDLKLTDDDLLYADEIFHKLSPGIEDLWSVVQKDDTTILAESMREYLKNCTLTYTKPDNQTVADIPAAPLGHFRSVYTKREGDIRVSKAIDVMLKVGWARIPFGRALIPGLGHRKIIEYVPDNEIDGRE